MWHWLFKGGEIRIVAGIRHRGVLYVLAFPKHNVCAASYALPSSHICSSLPVESLLEPSFNSHLLFLRSSVVHTHTSD